MFRLLLNILILFTICGPIFGIHCKHKSLETKALDTRMQKKWRKQHTFIANPNFKTASKAFDKQSKDIQMKELPPPHPGAHGGSSHGCESYDE